MDRRRSLIATIGPYSFAGLAEVRNGGDRARDQLVIMINQTTKEELMKRSFIITAGLAMALSMLWTLPGAAQEQDPGQVRQVQNEQRTRVGQPADAGNRILAREKAGAQGANAQGSGSRLATEPKTRQLGARDGSGNQGQGPMDGTGAGSPGQLGQRKGTGPTGATCTGDGPRGTAKSTRTMRSSGQQWGSAFSNAPRGRASRGGSRAGSGGRR